MYTSSGELYFSDCEKAEIDVCLNCTKPVEECEGDCIFDNASTSITGKIPVSNGITRIIAIMNAVTCFFILVSL